MSKYWDEIEYNLCLYCFDRDCDCSTHEEDIRERCISCWERKCKYEKCQKYLDAMQKYKVDKQFQ